MSSGNYYARILILASTLFLSGASLFQCTVGDSVGRNVDTGISVRDEQKISADSGNFTGNLDGGDQFGRAVADLGDLEADGVRDLVVGAPFDDDGGIDTGAVWVLFMDNNGQVDLDQKVSSTAGGFGGNLDADDRFGSAVAAIGDLNGDGAFDLAVGTPRGDDDGPDRGEVWILFLDAEGKVSQQQKIANSSGGFGGDLDNDDGFGSAVADIGDVNGDGITDLAVGAPNDDEGSNNAGAVWILMMNADGTVDGRQKITEGAGGFGGNLSADDNFGAAIAGIGDLDNDGIPDIAVGAPGGDDGGTDRGEVWIVFLDAGGRVRQQQRIADGSGDFGGDLDNDDRFGSALADTGDVDGDGITDLAVGAPNDDKGPDNAGAIWVLLMKTNGRVGGELKIAEDAGGFSGNLSANDNFGAAIAGIGDLDNDGVADLAVGAPGDDDGGADQGAVWILFMERES